MNYSSVHRNPHRYPNGPPSPEARCFEFFKTGSIRDPRAIRLFFPCICKPRLTGIFNDFQLWALLLYSRCPYRQATVKWTVTIATVLSVILLPIFLGSIKNVSGSESTKTGNACSQKLHYRCNKSEWSTRTSSPASNSGEHAVQLTVPLYRLAVARQRFAPISSAYFSSNSATYSPPPRHQRPDRNISMIPGFHRLIQYGHWAMNRYALFLRR